MHSLRLGLEAAAILLFIITSPGIDGRVVNEDAIEASIVLFRHHLAKNILPAMNQTGHITSASIQEVTPSKKRRRSSTSGGEAILKKVYKQVFSTVGFTVLVMERLDTLVQKVPLDDQQLLTISSGALVSLELDPANESGIKMTHQLHVSTIGTVTSIFRKYPRHRQIIVEDLFPILLKMPTHKKSMRTYPIQCSSVLYPSGLLALSKSLVPGENNHHPNQQLVVQTISVVILSFVQSCVVRPNLEMEEEAPQRTTDGSSVAPKLRSGLRDCQGICEMFVHLLLQRCSKKGEDGGASEFRPILSNLIDDFLLVVLVPEYPAAEMILRTIANTVSRDLSRAAQKVDAETTYLNTAFDALGKICAAEARILKSHRTKPVKLQVVVHSQEEEGQHADCYCQKKKNPASLELMLGCDRCCTWYHAGCVGLSRETVPQIWHCDACQLKRIIEFERDRNTNLGGSGVTAAFVDEPYCMRRLLIDYLSIVSRKTGAVGVQDAYELHVARSISELSSSSSPGSSSSHASGGGGGPITDPSKLPLFARLMELWDPRESSNIHDGMQQQGSDNTLNGMLHCLSDEGRGRMVVHLASTKSSLLGSFRSQVGFIVKLMSSDSSALLRRLAVKAIEKVRD